MQNDYTIEHALRDFLDNQADNRLSKIEIEIKNKDSVESHTWRSLDSKMAGTSSSKKFLSYDLKRDVDEKAEKGHPVLGFLGAAAICGLVLFL